MPGSENERRALAEAAQAAERAVTLDPRDARGLAVSGHVRGFLRHEVPEAVALCGRALEINPNLPMAQAFAGMAQAYAGELELARAHLSRALWLLPRNPHAFFAEAGLATVEMLRGEHARAVEIARGALQLQPRFTAALRAQIAALGHLGRVEEARPLIRDMLAIDPRFTLARFRAAIPYRRREQLDHFLRGLRLAGLA
jgi:tetratricopeptide (TPR) repeat protein